MQAQYGSYQFTANSASVLVRKDYELNAAGIPYIEKFEVDIEGYLTGAGQSALSTAEIALAAAMRIPFQDFVFKRDDGGRTGIYLQNATSLSGVRCIKGPSYTSKVGAEYANQRTFSLTIAATYPILNALTAIISFKERMQFSGGAPVYDFKPAINGEPQKQQLWFREPYQLVQSGEAYGFLDYPSVPPPAFPTAVMMAPTVEDIGPERDGINYKNFGRRWSYTMKSGSPLIAVPTLWR
jgi:hypothetical protein